MDCPVENLCDNPIAKDVYVNEISIVDQKDQEELSSDSNMMDKKLESEENSLQAGSESILQFDTSLAADGFIILSREAAVSLGVENDVDLDEPSTKKLRFQADDGKSYVLAVSDSMSKPESTGETTDEAKPGPSKIPNDVSIDQLAKSVKPQLVKVEEVPMSSCSLGVDDDGKYNDLNFITQSWFTTKCDKDAMHARGANWKQGQWTKEEVDILQHNISLYCNERNISDPTEVIFLMTKDERKDFYRTVAKGLNRPLFSVYRRVTRMYDQRNHIGKYSSEEMDKLKELKNKYGNDWASIGAELGRSASSVKDKCRLMKDTCNSGKWHPEEEERLSVAVYDLTGKKPGESVTSGLSWAMVAKRVKTRTEKQCRTKWLNYLNWKQKGGTEWIWDDDVNLIMKLSNMNVADDTEIDWIELAKNWSSVRSPQWLRGKWWSLKRRVPDYQILPFHDVINYLKTTSVQNGRIKSSIGGGDRVIGQKSLIEENMTVQLPVSLNLQQLNIETGGSIEDLQECDASKIQTIELLHQTSAGTFLITQPQGGGNAPVYSLSGTSLGADHIIVHTVPTNMLLGNLEAGENLSGVDCEMNTIQIPITMAQADIGDSNLESDIQAELEGQDMIQMNLKDAQLEDQEVLASDMENDASAELGVESQSMAENSAESTTYSQPSDSSANSQLISVINDPMLTSTKSYIMGSSSELDTEKSHS